MCCTPTCPSPPSPRCRPSRLRPTTTKPCIGRTSLAASTFCKAVQLRPGSGRAERRRYRRNPQLRPIGLQRRLDPQPRAFRVVHQLRRGAHRPFKARQLQSFRQRSHSKLPRDPFGGEPGFEPVVCPLKVAHPEVGFQPSGRAPCSPVREPDGCSRPFSNSTADKVLECAVQARPGDRLGQKPRAGGHIVFQRGAISRDQE